MREHIRMWLCMYTVIREIFKIKKFLWVITPNQRKLNSGKKFKLYTQKVMTSCKCDTYEETSIANNQDATF